MSIAITLPIVILLILVFSVVAFFVGVYIGFCEMLNKKAPLQKNKSKGRGKVERLERHSKNVRHTKF